MKESPRFFTSDSKDNNLPQNILCSLCPNNCSIQNGKFGICGIRGNKGGKALIPYYGHITALALDPIEKKPLYHFMPASSILSLGFSGCNLHCPFCQNWHISRNPDAEGKFISPEDVISLVLREKSDAPPSIAYTYSEPLVHAEYLLDCMSMSHKHGIANVLVTNGCINADAASEILSLTDAANIDLKSFSAETYSKILGGNLDAVIRFIKLAHAKNVHIELTTLVVPELNDSQEELDSIAQFIAGLSSETDPVAHNSVIPWHLSAYHPAYNWNTPPTDTNLLLRTAERARKILPYVYAGNIPAEENDTHCLSCGAVLVHRRGYKVDTSGLLPPAGTEKYYKCRGCGEAVPIIYR